MRLFARLPETTEIPAVTPVSVAEQEAPRVLNTLGRLLPRGVRALVDIDGPRISVQVAARACGAQLSAELTFIAERGERGILFRLPDTECSAMTGEGMAHITYNVLKEARFIREED